MKNIKRISQFFSFLLLLLLAISIISPNFLLAQPPSQGDPNQGPPSPSDCPPNTICSPLQDSNIKNLADFVNFILENIVLPIGSIIAVFFLIYAGFLFVTARGSEEKLTTAKNTFLWTVIGIAILLGAVVISNGIKNTICQIGDIPGLGCPSQNP